MYDEFERAAGGGEREGLSFLGWVAIAVGTLFALGIVAAAALTVAARHAIVDVAQEVRREVHREMNGLPARAAAEMVQRVESHAALLSTSPQEGAELLQSLDSGPPAQAFMEDFFGGSLDLFSKDDGFTLDMKGDTGGGSLQIGSGEDEFRMDLVKGDDGGSLVIDAGDEQIRFDLRKTEDGGFLTIDSGDGQVRFDLVRTDDGGSLIIQSEEGEVRFDASGNEDGGSLTITSEDGEFRFGAGEDAEAMPGWVPQVDGMPRNPQRVYSLASDEGSLGAVTWEAGDNALEILDFYREQLQDQGYELASEHRTRSRGEDRYSLWARDEAAGRMVFLVTEQMDGDTRVLLGYGEGE